MVKVAIVGAGPRGVVATARLLDHAQLHAVDVAVDVYDPAPPGRGAAYDETQPDFLRMNVRSAIVDMGWHTGPAPSAGWLPSLDTWRSGSEPPPLDPFPPRALVGRYLAEIWQRIVDHCPPGSAVRHVPRAVTDIRERAGGWLVDGSPYENVLLVTGHATDWPGALRHGWQASTPLVDAVFPVTEKLGTDAVPPGSRVAVRGAALTFIDAALALTEGRGGRFESEHGELRYRPSGLEPAVIWPVSRSGRWMEVKPDPTSPPEMLPLDDQRAAGLEQVGSAPTQEDAIDAVRETAHAYLAAAGDEGADDVDRLFGGLESGPPRDALVRSLVVATGRAAPGAAWAVGRAWRDLYPGLVQRFSLTGPGPAEDFGPFAVVAARMERLAFGPPAVNAAKLVALLAAGIVDDSSLGTATIDTGGLHWSGHDADVVIDAVLPPPGIAAGPATLPGALADRGLLAQAPGRRGLTIDAAGTCLAPDGRPLTGLAAAGRPTEDVVVGNDTLNQGLHTIIENWAARIVGDAVREVALRRSVRGELPLDGRLEPWMIDLLSDPDECSDLLERYGSPVNVIVPDPLRRNAAELVEAGAQHGVEVGIFFARKANKALALVGAANEAGHGVDVSSLAELTQVLALGVPAERVIVTAAVKPEPLLTEAVTAGVVISVDSVTELRKIARIARTAGRTADVMPRVAPGAATGLRPTRFGEVPPVWVEAVREWPRELRAVGVHVHLDGYAIADRIVGLDEALLVADALTAGGHSVRFVDLGGGVPMSYVTDEEQWRTFRQAAASAPEPDALLWRDRTLTKVYPFHQRPVRGEWLATLLTSAMPDGSTVADALVRRGLRLHLEPGRSLLDGCGITLARVAFTKNRSDGVPLVGLEMNRTQCRSTSDDFLVDPVLVRTQPGGDPTSGFLVGAYCIEDELILSRRLSFPYGVAPGDVLALVNTGGYLMHILESASHQIPLAANVFRTEAGWTLDAIDARENCQRHPAHWGA